MKVTLLGSGCWEGTPAPFCECKICRIATAEPNSIENRSRPEILVENEGSQFLMELSPDIRLQSTRFNLPPITDYIISHWHFDHLFGLYELHAWIELVLKSPITIYGSQAVKDMIDRQFGFIPTNFVVLRPLVPFMLAGIKITPIPVNHMRGSDEADADAAANNTFGYVLEHGDQKIAYLADYYDVSEASRELISGSTVVIADGTYLFENQYPNKPYQMATLEEKDPDHLHGDSILQFTQTLDAGKVVYHSITHLPEKTHDELQALLPRDQFVGYDGQVLLSSTRPER